MVKKNFNNNLARENSSDKKGDQCLTNYEGQLTDKTLTDNKRKFDRIFSKRKNTVDPNDSIKC